MKEKFLELKEKMMQNKKKTAMVIVAAVLLIGASGFGIAMAFSPGSEPVSMAQDSRMEKSTELNKKDKTDKKVTKADLDKKQDTKKEDKKQENEKVKTSAPEGKASADKKSNPDNSKGTTDSKQVTQSAKKEQVSTDNGNSGNHTPQPAVPEPQKPEAPTPQQPAAPEPQKPATPESSKPSHAHDFSVPVYGTETVYVVDQPAWTETVNDPIYEIVEICVCNSCGTDITASVEQHMLDYGHGWHSEWKQVQTGTNSYTVEHPEVGHNETKQIITGYKCSCGAVQ